MGMDAKTISILQSIYKDTNGCVLMDGARVTRRFCMARGLKQGCHLSALLFILYINDLYEWLEGVSVASPCVGQKEIKSLLYADDLVIMAKTVGGMRRMLDAMELYCKKWSLKINVGKSKIMTVSNGCRSAANEVWMYEGCMLENVKYFQYLGVTLAYNGKWSKHVRNLVHTSKKALFGIRRFLHGYEEFPIKICLRMFAALVLPIITYGSEIWALDCSRDSLRLINACGYNFYKEILCVPKSIPNSAVNLELDVMSVENVCIKKALNYYLRTVNGNKRLQNLCLSGKGREEYIVRLGELGFDEPFEDVSKKHVKVKIIEKSLLASLRDIRTKGSLNLYSGLNHYRGGAKYLSVVSRETRHLFATFRMYGFKWSSRKVGDERVCVLCGGIESVEHLMEDCEGTSGDKRQALISRELNTAQDMLNVSDASLACIVGEYLKFIIERRQLYL